MGKKSSTKRGTKMSSRRAKTTPARRVQAKRKVERIRILVVHGVGEQKRFEHLESVAANVYRALSKLSGRNPSIELRPGDQVPRLSSQESLALMPASIDWQTPDGHKIEAEFDEVYWADLDPPLTPDRWYNLVGWVLGLPGVYISTPRDIEDHKAKKGAYLLCWPIALGGWRRVIVRCQLFFLSLLFFIILITVFPLNRLVELFPVPEKFRFLRKFRNFVFSYLGDVKRYQDEFHRYENRLETIGKKTRVAVDRRMVRSLVRAAADVQAKKLDGFYIFAHSLGTVVAFRALMAMNTALPNYLTEKEWKSLQSPLKKRGPKPGSRATYAMPPDYESPADWLCDGDAIDRKELFRGFRGFLTVGSPLYSFVILWPHLVPINGESIEPAVHWYNVADPADIIATGVEGLPQCGDSGYGLGGLRLVHADWANKLSPMSAHMSYWRTQRSSRYQLIDRIVLWFETGRLRAPENVDVYYLINKIGLTRNIVSFVRWTIVAAIPIAAFLIMTVFIVWPLLGLAVQFDSKLVSILASYPILDLVAQYFVEIQQGLSPSDETYYYALLGLFLVGISATLVMGVVVVILFSIVHYLYWYNRLYR